MPRKEEQICLSLIMCVVLIGGVAVRAEESKTPTNADVLAVDGLKVEGLPIFKLQPEALIFEKHRHASGTRQNRWEVTRAS